MKLFTPITIVLLANWAQNALSIGRQNPLQAAKPRPPSVSYESSSTKALLALHKDLVTHESITENEDSVGQYLARYLESRNFTVEVQKVSSSPARNNIFAYLGKTRQTRILVSSHIDTVPPFWPYERRGDEIWGRGSVDAKGSGKAGHSGYPELGKSANAMLIPALNALLNVELPYSEKYGNTTLNIGRMQGGVAGNVIAEEASAVITLRIADGSPEIIQKAILKTVEKLGEELDISFVGGYGPVYIDSDVPGFETIVVNYGTDIPHLKGNHKKYLYGPGTILMAHSDHEHLKVSDLETAVKGYKALIEHTLN
ncbi:c6 zinc finger domain containing protein [Diplocarpon rosae]|nr:c6 zinc finger domain containing protein [Diplocarpon rosae]